MGQFKPAKLNDKESTINGQFFSLYCQKRIGQIFGHLFLTSVKLLVNKTVAHVVYYNERLVLERFMFFDINVCYDIVTV